MKLAKDTVEAEQVEWANNCTVDELALDEFDREEAEEMSLLGDLADIQQDEDKKYEEQFRADLDFDLELTEQQRIIDEENEVKMLNIDAELAQ